MEQAPEDQGPQREHIRTVRGA
uniref:Vpr protein n=1 Tax=Human immunodeficiency virus type 1 TaxID=11676 RepID=K0H257_HV1|nr:vpr protein [Human immunodeficiency virus 1]